MIKKSAKVYQKKYVICIRKYSYYLVVKIDKNSGE